jgi:hypothetical protein
MSETVAYARRRLRFNSRPNPPIASKLIVAEGTFTDTPVRTVRRKAIPEKNDVHDSMKKVSVPNRVLHRTKNDWGHSPD